MNSTWASRVGGFVCILMSCVGSIAVAQQATSLPPFVMALARDAQGNVWAGSEEQGVWRMDVSTRQWQSFGSKDGLGDDYAYAVACDRLGRIWVGHLNHGVSVYDGRRWQNYDVVGGLNGANSLAGPIGERGFDIAVCPKDGDVWIATNAGVTRYSESQKTWSYITRTDGLPADQVQAIAFDADGNVYAGTQCDGVGVAMAGDSYKTWHNTKGPDRMPLTLTGSGLPSGSINDIAVTRDGGVWVATTTGLALTRDHGATWQFIRGYGWSDKVRGLHGGPPKDWQEQFSDQQMPEDWVTTLAADDAGNLWLGYRMEGVWRINARGGMSLQSNRRVSARSYVNAILPTGTNEAFIATNGDAHIIPVNIPGGVAKAQAAEMTLPPGAPAPTTAELDNALQQVQKMIANQQAQRPLHPMVAALADDWRTRGDWLGRYGKYWAALTGFLPNTPPAYFWGAGAEKVDFIPLRGPNITSGDVIRYWTSKAFTNDPRSLEIPQAFLQSQINQRLTTAANNRRQTEVADNSQGYSLMHDGPDLIQNVSIPPGVFTLSIFTLNDNGHSGDHRYRDYTVSVRPWVDSKDGKVVEGFDDQPELARGRFRDFWSGYYKRFLVQGPTKLSIRISKDYAHNTKISAILLDSIDAMPEPYFNATALAAAANSADRLTDAIEGGLHGSPSRAQAESFEAVYVQLARWYQQMLNSDATKSPNRDVQIRYATCLYRLRYFQAMEDLLKNSGIASARQIERSVQPDGDGDYSGKGREMVFKSRNNVRSGGQ